MRHGRRDSTHGVVRRTLRDLGCSVYDTGDVGHNFPDFVVGLLGRDYLVEVKSPKGDLSDGQAEFARSWQGSKPVVLRSAQEAAVWVLAKHRGVS